MDKAQSHTTDFMGRSPIELSVNIGGNTSSVQLKTLYMKLPDDTRDFSKEVDVEYFSSIVDSVQKEITKELLSDLVLSAICGVQ